jgi:heme-degrading monooxygenase HmoA
VSEVISMVVQIVRFRSGLPDERVLQLYEARAPRYRALTGLIQKYYLRFAGTGEHGAVYVWESDDALKEFRESDFGQTIASTYRIEGSADIRPAEVVMTLRPKS